jgi:hypothetical protein
VYQVISNHSYHVTLRQGLRQPENTAIQKPVAMQMTSGFSFAQLKRFEHPGDPGNLLHGSLNHHHFHLTISPYMGLSKNDATPKSSKIGPF